MSYFQQCRAIHFYCVFVRMNLCISMSVFVFVCVCAQHCANILFGIRNTLLYLFLFRFFNFYPPHSLLLCFNIICVWVSFDWISNSSMFCEPHIMSSLYQITIFWTQFFHIFCFLRCMILCIHIARFCKINFRCECSSLKYKRCITSLIMLIRINKYMVYTISNWHLQLEWSQTNQTEMSSHTHNDLLALDANEEWDETERQKPSHDEIELEQTAKQTNKLEYWCEDEHNQMKKKKGKTKLKMS